MDLLHYRIAIFLFCTKCDRMSYFPVCMAFGKKIILTEGNFIHFPLITLSLFVLLLMYYVFPIFFTLLDGHAVTYRMENPLITFFYQSLYITSLVISFIIFRKIYNSNNWLNKLWLRIGIYKSPTIREAVILSAIGFLHLYILFLQPLMMEAITLEDLYRN